MGEQDKVELTMDQLEQVQGGGAASGPLLAALGAGLAAGLAAFLKAFMSPVVAVGAMFSRH